MVKLVSRKRSVFAALMQRRVKKSTSDRRDWSRRLVLTAQRQVGRRGRRFFGAMPIFGGS
jgi:hypothetical protein